MTTSRHSLMREPKLITALRHAVLLVFVAISLYPALNVLSISLRPGNRLRVDRPGDHSRRLDASHSYVELFTEQPFLRWLGNSLLVATVVTVTGVALASIGGYAFSRFRFVGRKATMLADPHHANVSRHDAAAAALHPDRQARTCSNTYLGLMVFYTSTALPFCVWQMKGFYDTIPASLEEAARIDGCSAGPASSGA